LKSQEPKITGVNSTNKTSFVAKISKYTNYAERKSKISNEDYTNNGSRQISSIPFVTLSYGIALSESILDATACRRRPADEISREQFTTENTAKRFKSHIPIVNSARLNVYATIDDTGKQTARSSFFENTISVAAEKRDFETTFESRRVAAGSILWRPRAKSSNRDIRISNR
jgi:hypothetical protein